MKVFDYPPRDGKDRRNLPTAMFSGSHFCYPHVKIAHLFVKTEHFAQLGTVTFANSFERVRLLLYNDEVGAVI